MKYKIIYKVCGMNFEAIANNVYETYKYVEAIIKTNPTTFTHHEEMLSEYMCILADMKNKKTVKHDSHVFNFEIITEEKQ